MAEIRTLYDGETQVIPRTKTEAIERADGTPLETLLTGILYADEAGETEDADNKAGISESAMKEYIETLHHVSRAEMNTAIQNAISGAIEEIY